MSHAAVTAPSVSLRRYGAIEASDVHDFHQVVLGLDGAMVMAVDGVAHQIDAGSAWLIPAGARHDYAGVGENRQLVLDLPATSLAVPERLFDRARAVTVDASLTQLVHRIAAHATGGAQGDDLDTRRFHWDAAARLGAALVADTGTAAGAQASGARPRLRAYRPLAARSSVGAAAYRRPRRPLRLRHAALSSAFYRRLRRNAASLFAASAARYVACACSSDPRLSLSDIALEIGFGDQSAYTHAFTRRFGLAPGQWRALRH